MKLLVSLLFATVIFISTSIRTQNKTITASIENISSDEGKVGFALYTKDNFMKEPIMAKNAKIENGKTIVEFKNVVPGEYAIICYHDKNNNDRMDFSANRMPIEDYGVSNNVMSFGPPNYDDAKFVVADKNVSLIIKF
ncbi:MAG: DUF2141 domain-containing protein [Polaribacter sp.]|jgi:uncharacterized protein (DUF2141 family)